MRTLMALSLTLMFSNAVNASAKPATIAFEETHPAQILEIVDGWRAMYDSGEVLLKPSEVESYERQLAQIAEFLRERESWDDLGKRQRLDFVNDFEKLRALTDGGEARGNRRICTRERKPGSNFKQTVCVTAAEQARIDKLNQSALSDIERNGRRQNVSSQ